MIRSNAVDRPWDGLIQGEFPDIVQLQNFSLYCSQAICTFICGNLKLKFLFIFLALGKPCGWPGRVGHPTPKSQHLYVYSYYETRTGVQRRLTMRFQASSAKSKSTSDSVNCSSSSMSPNSVSLRLQRGSVEFIRRVHFRR